MKKVVITHGIHVLLDQNYSFLNRTDIKLFVAETNDKALKVHLKERVDLIILESDTPGLPSDQFCSLIRKDANLRAVSLIMVCENTPAALEQSKQCGANVVLARPVHPIVLMEKAQQLLDIAARRALRVGLTASVDGRAGGSSFSCRVRNISSTGMLIESGTPLGEGAVLSCLFSLPDAKKVQSTCKVVRTVKPSPGDEGRQYGVMFTDIAPEAKKLLIDFVERTSPGSRPDGS